MSFSERLKNALWSLKRSRPAHLWLFGVLVVGLAAVGGYVVFGGSDGASPEDAIDDGMGNSGLTPRAIDGVLVDPAMADYFPVAIVIENEQRSRPSAGLDQANLVYEALAEGGITRFLAVFADGTPIAEIGPVRSARAYFVTWAAELDALYAHIGGSPEALDLIEDEDVNDLNQFFASQYYWRDTSRLAPHNLYTSSEKMAFALRDGEYPVASSYDRWQFRDGAASGNREALPKVLEIDFSTSAYLVAWRWDPARGVFIRDLAGEPHVVKGGAPIEAVNVVVQEVSTRVGEAGRLSLDLIGEGTARIYRDGLETVGTWRKDSFEDRTKFFDESNAAIEFNRGTTWIEVVTPTTDITYQ